MLPPPRKVYRPEGHDYAAWRIPTQAPPKNAFIPDDRGDAWQPGVGGGGQGYLGGSAGDLDDGDEYNGEDRTPGGLGHLNTRKGKWVPDYRASAPRGGVNEPFRDGLTSYGRSFDAPDYDDLPAWTRRSGRGSNPDPNAQGAYYTKGPGPVPGNRRASHPGAWLQAPLQQLHDVDVRRSASKLTTGDSSVGTQWVATAQAAEAAAKFAAESAAEAVPVLTEPGSSTGLFGGITGTASGSTVSSLWGDSYDASQS